MKTVISASRRTDIPAFYLDWFLKAIQNGSLEVRNPFYRKSYQTVKLSADYVRWIVFWSRNYAKFIKHRSFFQEYQLFFHFTILPQSILERSALTLKQALSQLELLSHYYGSDHIIWRYDPMVHWSENNKILSNHDLNNFKILCKNIGSLEIKKCYTSFVNIYEKYKRRFHKAFPDKQIYELDWYEQSTVLNAMVDVAEDYGITIYSCSNDKLLNIPKIHKGHCIDGPLLNALDKEARISVAKSPSRKDCGCTKSIDIGDYFEQPCYFGCLYCYANPVGF